MLVKIPESCRSSGYASTRICTSVDQFWHVSGILTCTNQLKVLHNLMLVKNSLSSRGELIYLLFSH